MGSANRQTWLLPGPTELNASPGVAPGIARNQPLASQIALDVLLLASQECH